MNSAHSPQGMTRRQLFRRGGAAAVGTAAVLGGGSAIAPRYSPIGRARAVAPLVLAGGLAGAAAIGWALGESDALGSDAPSDGLSGPALIEDTIQTARKRKSTNASTIIDNKNILKGVEHTAYADGKKKAIEKLNNGGTKQEVKSAATSHVSNYQVTVESNLLKSWNESATEFVNMYSQLNSHSSVTPDQVLEVYDTNWEQPLDKVALTDTTVTFPEGTSFTIKELDLEGTNNIGDPLSGVYGPESGGGSSPDDIIVEVQSQDADEDLFTYLDVTNWVDIRNQLQTSFDSVRSGLQTWVDNVYDQVEAGELDTSELLTPRDLAEMAAGEDGVNQALADLMALNIPVNLEREATIEIDRSNETVTAKGVLAPTSPPADGMSVGTTYDPSSMEGDVYFTYDVTQGSGTWSSYNATISAGVVEFTREPYSDTSYEINTAAGGVAEVSAADFTEDSSNGVWTVDISEQVTTVDTEVDSVEILAPDTETKYETVLLRDAFTIKKFTDSDGNEFTTATFDSNEPQTDTNYITEEEWKELQERNQELIEKFNEEKNDGGGPLFAGFSGGGGLAGLGAVAVVVAAIAAVVRR